MTVLNRNYIAPRVQVAGLRGKYTSKPLSKAELDEVLSLLESKGIEFGRIVDDACRYLIDEILELI